MLKIEKIVDIIIHNKQQIKKININQKINVMIIFTSFFDNIKNLSENEFFFVCIRGDHPEWFNGFVYKPLIPKKWWFEWNSLKKNTPDQYYFADNFYREKYLETNLSKTTPEQVISELNQLANGRKIVLVCGEIPPLFCHRRIIDSWLSKSGMRVQELDCL